MDKNYLTAKYKSGEIFSCNLLMFSDNCEEVIINFENFLLQEIEEIRQHRVLGYQHFIELQKITNAIYFISDSLDFQYQFNKSETFENCSQQIWGFFCQNIHEDMAIGKKLNVLKAKLTGERKYILTSWVEGNMRKMSSSKSVAKVEGRVRENSKQIIDNIEKSINDKNYCLIFKRDQLSKLDGIMLGDLKKGLLHAKSLQLKDCVAFAPTKNVTSSLLMSINDQELRKKVYLNHIKNNNAKKEYNNDKLLTQLVKNKYKLAQLHNKSNYYELISENYFIKDTKSISHFLTTTQALIQPQNEKIMQEIASHAAKKGIENLNPWDILYFEREIFADFHIDLKNKYKITLKYALSQIIKMFRDKFKVSIKKEPCKDIERETKGRVQTYKIYDKDSGREGYLVFNLLKKDCAFYDCTTIRPHFKVGRKNSTNVSIISGCFARNENELIDMNKVVDIIHEVGHAFQAFYAQYSNSEFSTVRNYCWDLIELPSQFMERLMFEEKNVMRFLTNRKDLSPEIKFKDAQKWIRYYIFYRFTMLKEDLNLNISKFNLFNCSKSPEDVANYLKQNLETGVFFNPCMDYYLLESDYQVDYGPSNHVYLINDILAHNIYENLYKKKKISMSHLYRNIFNAKTKKGLHKNIRKGLDYSQMNLIDYIKRGKKVDFELIDSI